MDDDEDASALTDDSLLRAVAGAPPRAPAEPPLAAGTILGGFRVVSKVGAGGMGVVYRAEDEQLRRDVALKVIASARDSSPTERRRFLREARSAAAVNHPNVATIFEVGEDAGRIFIAMELVSGITLRSKLAEGPLGIEEVLGIARQIARGLAKAHALGIVHRDLKPDNVMLGELVKVLDFGLARGHAEAPAEVASTATAQDLVAGTPGYMSPEQVSGEPVDPRTDVFAFGVVLYEMVAGERPFLGNTMLAISIATARDPHRPLSGRRSDVPPELDQVVDRCLAKNASERYANLGEVLIDLEALALTPAAASQRSTSRAAPAVAQDSPRRSRWLAVGVGVAVVAGIAIWRSSLPAVPVTSALPSVPSVVPVAPFAPFAPDLSVTPSSPATPTASPLPAAAKESAPQTPSGMPSVGAGRPRPALAAVPPPSASPAPSRSAAVRPLRDPLGDQR